VPLQAAHEMMILLSPGLLVMLVAKLAVGYSCQTQIINHMDCQSLSGLAAGGTIETEN